jgi:hypothetical protein
MSLRSASRAVCGVTGRGGGGGAERERGLVREKRVGFRPDAVLCWWESILFKPFNSWSRDVRVGWSLARFVNEATSVGHALRSPSPPRTLTSSPLSLAERTCPPQTSPALPPASSLLGFHRRPPPPQQRERTTHPRWPPRVPQTAPAATTTSSAQRLLYGPPVSVRGEAARFVTVTTGEGCRRGHKGGWGDTGVWGKGFFFSA